MSIKLQGYPEKSRRKMDCSLIIVDELCYPRYAFMKKQVTDLKNMGRKLLQRLELIKSSMVSNKLNLDLKKRSDDDRDIENIILLVIQPSEAQIISEDDIIMRAGTIQKYKLSEDEKMEFQRYFNLLRDGNLARVKLYHYLSGELFQNIVYVLTDKIKRKKLRVAIDKSKGKKKLQHKTEICRKHDFSKVVCRLLEVNIFKQLKTTYEKLCVLEEKMSHSMNITLSTHGKVFSHLFEGFDEIENLLEDITGLYQRSQVPEEDRPNFADRERTVSLELLKDFRNVSELINRCGYRNSTLYVFVDLKNPEGQLIQDIDTVLKKHGIYKYSVVSSFINEYAGCASGSKAEIRPKEDSPEKRYGTLGGYVYVDDKKRLGALISRHVARCSCDGRVHILNPVSSVHGQIMPEVNARREDAVVAYIDEEDKDNCNFAYITENKDPVPGIQCQLQSLKGLPVHIAGATTPLGLGKVAISKCYTVQQTSACEDIYVYVEDRKYSKGLDEMPFCQKGDSGSMVCTHDPDSNGEKVQLISMVMGELKEEAGLYCTVKLKDALEQIERETGKKLSLC